MPEVSAIHPKEVFLPRGRDPVGLTIPGKPRSALPSVRTQPDPSEKGSCPVAFDFHLHGRVTFTMVNECGRKLTTPLAKATLTFSGATRSGCSMSLKASGESPASTVAS